MTRMGNFPRGAAVVMVGTLGLGLSACGGGGGSAAAPPAVPPAAASVPAQVSTAVPALIAWASHLPENETAQPLTTDTFHPPVDDSAEPTSIN